MRLLLLPLLAVLRLVKRFVLRSMVRHRTHHPAAAHWLTWMPASASMGSQHGRTKRCIEHCIHLYRLHLQPRHPLLAASFEHDVHTTFIYIGQAQPD